LNPDGETAFLGRASSLPCLPAWVYDPTSLLRIPAAMDAPEDDLDIKLQKISGDLIADFDRSLPLLLRKSDGAGGSRIRSKATWRETGRLIASVRTSPMMTGYYY